MKTSKVNNVTQRNEETLFESTYQQLLMLTKKSKNILDLIAGIKVYLKHNPESQSLLEKASYTNIFIENLLNDSDLKNTPDGLDCERNRIYFGCLAVHIIKIAVPDFEEKHIVFDCIKKVINNLYIKNIKNTINESRKYSFYGNTHSIILDEFKSYIDLYLEDAEFRDLIFKILKEQMALYGTIHKTLTPSAASVIYYIDHYVRFLKELGQADNTNEIFNLEYNILKENIEKLSSNILENCNLFYKKLISQINEAVSTQYDFFENNTFKILIQDFEALMSVTRLMLSIDLKDKEMKDEFKQIETKILPKIFLNFKNENSNIFRKAEESGMIPNDSDSLHRMYEKYDKLLNQGSAIKLNDELCQFIVYFFKNPSNIYQRQLINGIFNNILKRQAKNQSSDANLNEIETFINLHKIGFFNSLHQRITAQPLTIVKDQDIKKYMSTNAPQKDSNKKNKSQSHVGASKKKQKSTNKTKSATLTSTTTKPQEPSQGQPATSLKNQKNTISSPKAQSSVPTQASGATPNSLQKQPGNSSNKKKNTKNKKNKKRAKKQSTLTEIAKIDLSQQLEKPECKQEAIESSSVSEEIISETPILSFMPKAALNHMHPISQLGYNVYMFGGAVRDILWKDLGRSTNLQYNDVDLVTDIPEKIFLKAFPFAEKSKFIPNLFHVRNAGDGHGLTTVDIKLVPDLNLEKFFSEGYLAVDSLACDLNGKIIDPLNALDRFNTPELNFVNNNRNHFSDNPERILKTIKTACHLPASLGEELVQSISEHKQELTKLDLSHMLSLLSRICLKQQEDIGFKMLIDLQLIDSLFPVMGQNIQSCSSKNTIIYSFMLDKFKTLNALDFPCSKYTLLSVFLVPYFEKMMTLDMFYYNDDEIKTRIEFFFSKANIKPSEKNLWVNKTFECFKTYWKEFEAYEVNKRYNVTFTPGYQAILGNSSITPAQDPTNISKARIAP